MQLTCVFQTNCMIVIRLWGWARERRKDCRHMCWRFSYFDKFPSGEILDTLFIVLLYVRLAFERLHAVFLVPRNVSSLYSYCLWGIGYSILLVPRHISSFCIASEGLDTAFHVPRHVFTFCRLRRHFSSFYSYILPRGIGIAHEYICSSSLPLDSGSEVSWPCNFMSLYVAF